MTFLRRHLMHLAAGAPAAIYPVIGPGRLSEAELLMQDPRLRRATTPRDAALLLICGPLPDSATEAVQRLHDQLPRPLRSVNCDGPLPDPAALSALWRALATGGGSETDILPDEPPNPWEGIGSHGQGGKGMMGGVPYGRPMPMTRDDLRDGLTLDIYRCRIGPFAPMLPPGMELELGLQGDVIVELAIAAPPFAQDADASRPTACAARLLRLLGLDIAADRVSAGRSAGAPLARLAIAQGLAPVAGQDLRARLTTWLADGQVAAPPTGRALGAMLIGLEWSEAMLVLNSFAPDALRAACLADDPADPTHEHGEEAAHGPDAGP